MFWRKKIVNGEVISSVVVPEKETPPIPPTPKETTSSVTPHVPNGARVMITNGGPHPAELWAQVSAEHIAPIAADMTGHRRAAALALQSAIAKIIEQHYNDIQGNERIKLKVSTDHILTSLDHDMESMVTAIQTAAVGTEWETHFNHDAVVELLTRELEAHVKTVKHIERSWHVDRNPDHPHAMTWRGN